MVHVAMKLISGVVRGQWRRSACMVTPLSLYKNYTRIAKEGPFFFDAGAADAYFRLVNPEPLFEALLAYRISAVLRAAIELDYFSALAEGKHTAAEVAASRGGTERSARILLDAVAASVPA